MTARPGGVPSQILDPLEGTRRRHWYVRRADLAGSEDEDEAEAER